MGRIAQFERDGLVFDVRDSGPVDAGAAATVVLLHGWPQDGSAFDDVVPLLHAQGLRTLVPDLRGSSRRARPAGAAAYRLGESGRDVLALLDAAGLEGAHVVGHDWGGALAWSLAGRSGPRVTTLTVLSTPHPSAIAHALTHSTQALRSWYMGFFQLPWLPEQVLARTLPRVLRGSGLPEPAVQRYLTRLREPGALTGSLNWYRAMLTRPAPGPRRPASGPRRAVPTTFVWGRDDPALGRAAALATARFVTGDYRFVELPAGHWLPETRPQECAAAIIDRVARVGDAR